MVVKCYKGRSVEEQMAENKRSSDLVNKRNCLKRKISKQISFYEWDYPIVGYKI